MRLGLVIYGRLETISGGYLYDRKLVRALREAGDTVEIISLPWGNYGRHLSHNLSPAIDRRLRDLRCDLLLQDELNHPSLFWLNRRLRQRPYLIVSIVHHLRSSERHPPGAMPFYRWVERRYLDSVDGFIYNSGTTRRAVGALAPAAATRPFLIAPPAADHRPVPLEPATIRARAMAPGPLRLLFVGALIRRKGLPGLLAAVSRLPRSAWRLDVVGDTAVSPATSQRIRRQIRLSGLDDNVTLHGRLNDGALNKLLEQSHLLTVPSYYEGFGIVYLEGMGAGLPAIAGREGAASELITHGVNGFLVDPNDPGAIAYYLQRLHRNRAKLADMALAAYRRYQVHPTWGETTDRIRAFLVKMASRVDRHASGVRGVEQ